MYIDDSGRLNFDSRGDVSKLIFVLEYYRQHNDNYNDKFSYISAEELNRLIDDLDFLHFTF